MNNITRDFPLIKTAIPYLPALWVGSIALGPSIEAIFFVLLLMSLTAQTQLWPQLKHQLNSRWFIALSLVALWTTLSVLWAPHWDQETWFSLKKVYRLLLIPLVTLAFTQEEAKARALDCFLLTMSLTACLALAKFSHLLVWRDLDPGHLFYNHILTGFMAALAAYVSLALFCQTRHTRYMAQWVLFTLQVLVINPGKMAYVLYLALMLYWACVQYTQHLPWKRLLLFCAGLSGLLLLSPTGRHGFSCLLHAVVSTGRARN